MYQFDIEQPAAKFREDHALGACVLLLTGLGLVTLYSSSYAFASRFEGFNNDGLYFVSRQLKFGLVGIVLFFTASLVNLEWMRKFIKPLVVGAVILCVLTLVPGIGVEKNSASRWIGRANGLTYQPSELVKLVLPLYLAHIFDKKQDDLDRLSTGVLPPILVTALFFMLINWQNNFSTAVFIALNALVIFFVAGVPFKFFCGAVVMFLPISTLLLLMREHRVRRFMTFIRPNLDPLGAGYQVRNSLFTIISGGFWGKGIGQGTWKISSVPEIHSDFIFSAFAEEAGFLGVVLFFLLIAAFAVLGYRTAWYSESVFRRLLVFGMVTMILSQLLANIAVIAGALPATGIPLPFFSAGGSSLATTLVCAGLIVNVCRQNTISRSAKSSSVGGTQNVQ